MYKYKLPITERNGNIVDVSLVSTITTECSVRLVIASHCVRLTGARIHLSSLRTNRARSLVVSRRTHANTCKMQTKKDEEREKKNGSLWGQSVVCPSTIEYIVYKYYSIYSRIYLCVFCERTTDTPPVSGCASKCVTPKETVRERARVCVISAAMAKSVIEPRMERPASGGRVHFLVRIVVALMRARAREVCAIDNNAFRHRRAALVIKRVGKKHSDDLKRQYTEEIAAQWDRAEK